MSFGQGNMIRALWYTMVVVRTLNFNRAWGIQAWPSQVHRFSKETDVLTGEILPGVKFRQFRDACRILL
jgi:hypothetical protein